MRTIRKSVSVDRDHPAVRCDQKIVAFDIAEICSCSVIFPCCRKKPDQKIQLICRTGPIPIFLQKVFAHRIITQALERHPIDPMDHDAAHRSVFHDDLLRQSIFYPIACEPLLQPKKLLDLDSMVFRQWKLVHPCRFQDHFLRSILVCIDA